MASREYQGGCSCTGLGGSVTVTTIYGDVADGVIRSGPGTFTQARDGISLAIDDTNAVTNQTTGLLDIGDHYFYEFAEGFDTSSIPDTDVVSLVVFSIWDFGSSADAFTVQARLSDWGATLTTADWVAGASLAALTLLATFATSTGNVGNYANFTENGTNFRTAINKTGFTRFLLVSDDQVNNTDPGVTSKNDWLSADQGGTANDPKLVITHASPTAMQDVLGMGVIPFDR